MGEAKRIASNKHSCAEENFYNAMRERDDIILLGKYVRSDVKIKVRCAICGHTWDALPGNLKKGHGCKKCAIVRLFEQKRAQAEKAYIEYLQLGGVLCLLEPYSTMQTPTKHKCLVCGHEWSPLLDNIKRGHGCPECAIKYQSALHFDYGKLSYLEHLKNQHSTVHLVGEYNGFYEDSIHECDNGHRFLYSPVKMHKLGYGCPVCSNMSYGEREVAHVLSTYGILFDPQHTFDDCKYRKQLLFDFYIPSQHACIEYQGQQHYGVVSFRGEPRPIAFRNFLNGIKRDYIKYKYCERHGIKLYRIPYTQRNHVEEWLIKHGVVNVSETK